jgi:TolB protein
MKIDFKPFFTAILLGACSLAAKADEQPIVIQKTNTYVVPISISGFEGEVESVLKFDLYVLGMEVTSPDKASYLISGSQNGRVEGRLTAAGASQPLWARAYAGGVTRSQAHAFANDIVKEIRGTAPIFQTRIAFRGQEGRSTEFAEIAVSDFDGYNAKVLTHDGTSVEGPCWIPGGGGLLYTSWKNDGEEILEHNLNTGTRRVFADYPGANLSPEVSPDGQKVAMILSRSGIPNLWVCNRDGSGLKQLTRTRDEDSCPTWSPDSREICFVCRSGHARLQKVSVDGGSAHAVSVAGVYGNLTSPDWSPDGKWIAFTSGSGNFTICVVPAEGGDAQKLVAGEDPCWAPNSRTIVFSRRVSNKQILCLLDVPTKHVKDVRQMSGSCSEPSWAR